MILPADLGFWLNVAVVSGSDLLALFAWVWVLAGRTLALPAVLSPKSAPALHPSGAAGLCCSPSVTQLNHAQVEKAEII